MGGVRVLHAIDYGLLPVGRAEPSGAGSLRKSYNITFTLHVECWPLETEKEFFFLGDF